ncbi:hypothetical protein VKT23_012322 [Stygiomarasmius scandens]|uniref:Uncharacterized protein n=1 Tax=Marasmiellus scandens TaxID=2682957 RepID=A0ABR1J7C9_9AGAR
MTQESNETHQQQMEGLKAIHDKMRIELEGKLKAMKTQHEEEKQKNAALEQQIVNLQVEIGDRENSDTLKAQLEDVQRDLMISNVSYSFCFLSFIAGCLKRNQHDQDDAQAALAGARIEMDENNALHDATQKELNNTLALTQNKKLEENRRQILDKVEGHKQNLTKIKANHTEYVEKCEAVIRSANEEKEKLVNAIQKRNEKIQKQNDTIARLEKEVNELKSSAASSSSESRERNEMIRNQKDTIERLEREVTELKSAASNSTGQTPLSTGEWFGPGRKTLGRAPVTDELLRARGAESSSRRTKGYEYRLGNVIQSSSGVPWGNQKPSRFTKTGRRMRKGNPGWSWLSLTPAIANQMMMDEVETADRHVFHGPSGEGGDGGRGDGRGNDCDGDADISSDESENGDDGKGERDDHTIHRKWERMGIQKRYTPGEQATNANRLVHALVLTCLGSKHLFEAFARDSVDDARLQNFLADPEEYQPRLHNSRLDKRGVTTNDMLKSRWNQTLMHKLADEASFIFRNTNDKRFGDEQPDWVQMIRTRIRPVLKTDLLARPQFPGEALRDRILRVASQYEKIKETNKNNNVLHMKYHVRSSVATIMIQACRERGDKEGVETWQYVLRCLEKLKHGGMSDEEEGIMEASLNGQQTTTRVRKVLRLPWRHSSFRGLFEMVDGVRGAESSIFRQQGRPPLERVRVDASSSNRVPPKHLPESLFDPNYLKEVSKFPYQLTDLCMSKKPFPIYETVYLPRDEA